MAITQNGIQLKQDPKDPNKMWIEFTQVYGSGPNANGYPQQYTLTPEQFAQFQNAGLKPQFEFNNPLAYNQGQYQQGILQQVAQGSDPTVQAVAQKVDTAPTTGGTNLQTDTATRQNLLDYSYGGSKNVPSGGKDPNASSPSALNQSSSGQVTGMLNGQLTTFTDAATAAQYGATNISGGTTGGSQGANSGSTGSNPDLGPYADLYKQMQDYLTKLQQNGQIINPNVQITPDQLAAFATQAASQIHPYYATQLAAATDSFLSGLGYNTDQFKNSINQAQVQYDRNLDALGSTSADQGFAQSGIRQKKEGDLASDTQNNLDQLRGSLFNNSQNSARQFATTYGGANVPGAPTIGSSPRVLPGQSQFDTSGSQQGLYSLDPSIYQRLIGTEQNSEKQATDTLASQLATNSNQLTANTQARSLL